VKDEAMTKSVDKEASLEGGLDLASPRF